MKLICKFLLAYCLLALISACNSDVDRLSVLKKCTVLGDESIIYARAHYVKLFYHFNPSKFSDSHKQISNFDAVTHRNTIDTYTRAIDKIDVNKKEYNDKFTQNLLTSCKELSKFSIDFVEENYRLAIRHQSKNGPLTDAFFIEINKLVKFDHSIGYFDESQKSFKDNVDNFQKAVADYINHYRENIPETFANQRKSK